VKRPRRWLRPFRSPSSRSIRFLRATRGPTHRPVPYEGFFRDFLGQRSCGGRRSRCARPALAADKRRRAVRARRAIDARTPGQHPRRRGRPPGHARHLLSHAYHARRPRAAHRPSASQIDAPALARTSEAQHRSALSSRLNPSGRECCWCAPARPPAALPASDSASLPLSRCSAALLAGNAARRHATFARASCAPFTLAVAERLDAAVLVRAQPLDERATRTRLVGGQPQRSACTQADPMPEAMRSGGRARSAAGAADAREARRPACPSVVIMMSCASDRRVRACRGGAVRICSRVSLRSAL
jgi:hypothetical protein